MLDQRSKRRCRVARSACETLEVRRCFSYVLPAYADQLGLTGLVDPNTTFEDNFDGSTLDSSKWQVRVGPRWKLVKDGPVSTMTNTTQDSVRVNNGNLELIAHNDPVTGNVDTGWIQSSDNYLSKYPDGVALPKLADGYSGHFEQAYGYWEARMKFSSLPGEWGAFWVHSYKMTEIAHDPTRINHPEIYGTEYDVVEHGAIRNNADVTYDVSQTDNWNGYDEYYSAQAIHTAPVTLSPSYSGPDQFHVYGLLWTNTSVKFTVDGHVTFVLTDPNAISKIAQSVILSNEAGAPGALEAGKGSNYWGSVPAGGYGSLDTSQAKVTVDYVRVWRIPSLPVPTPAQTNGATIDGVAYQDTDYDGLYDANEPVLANRTVWVDLDSDGALDHNEPSLLTASDGSYSFTGLSKGIYTIRMVSDGTSSFTAPKNDADATVSLSGNVRASIDFGLVGNITTPPVTTPPVTTPPVTTPTVTTASIVGSVFNDVDGDGALDAGEIGQGGISVYLDSNLNGSRDANEPITTTAATTGAFRFDGVAISSALAVRLALSGSGYSQTMPADSAGARWLATVAGVTHTVAAFGVRGTTSTTTTPPPVTTTTPPSSTLAAITGLVFNDTNGNGRQDAGELGRAGVLVFLDYNYNNTRDSDEPQTASGSSGTYRFDGVRVTNALAVRMNLAGTGMTQTLPSSSQSIWLTTSAGREQAIGSFGVTGGSTTNTTTTPAAGTGSITGTVYNDVAKNAHRDSGDAGVANVLIYVDTNLNGRRDAGETLSATTAADGSYRIDNVPPATPVLFTAVRIDLANTSLTQTTTLGAGAIWINTVAGQVFSGNDFGVSGTPPTGTGGTTTTTPPPTANTSTITGTVFVDANRNGTRDNDAAGVGAVVYVDDNYNGKRDAGELYALADANGSYVLNGVRVANGIAVRTELTDGAYLMTTPSGAGARWLNTAAGQVFGNVNIGVALR